MFISGIGIRKLRYVLSSIALVTEQEREDQRNMKTTNGSRLS
jgi:hypothetical protein